MSGWGYGWHAHLTDDWAVGGSRLFLVREAGPDDIEVVTGFTDDGFAVITRQGRAVRTDFPGLLIPRDALDSLGALLRPDAGGPEVRRLEEALAVERARVDQLLAVLTRQDRRVTT